MSSGSMMGQTCRICAVYWMKVNHQIQSRYPVRWMSLGTGTGTGMNYVLVAFLALFRPRVSTADSWKSRRARSRPRVPDWPSVIIHVMARWSSSVSTVAKMSLCIWWMARMDISVVVFAVLRRSCVAVR
jgi:hypothetical protein